MPCFKMKSFSVIFIYLLIFCSKQCNAFELHNVGKIVSKIKSQPENFINLNKLGVIGDGINDDTQAFQRALNVASLHGMTCLIPSNYKILIKKPIYIWGSANIFGEDLSSTIIFDVKDSNYLVNIGISGVNKLEKIYKGVIHGVTFDVSQKGGGRILYFWRTDSAIIANNLFKIGLSEYSATSSGNDNRIVVNGQKNCVRKNILIIGNVIEANSTSIGSEGFGLVEFNGARIESNVVKGVGDDPIAIHFSENVVIDNNELSSVDGRLFVSNSKNVTIENNVHERISSSYDNKYYEGIGLLYLGFESYDQPRGINPENIQVRNNKFIYNNGAIDKGGAIYVYSPRDISINDNVIINNSHNVKAAGLRLLPAKFKNFWQDPYGKDSGHVAKVYDIDISGNKMLGIVPLSMVMTGDCVDYKGVVVIKNNTAREYNFYCENMIIYNNIVSRNDTN